MMECKWRADRKKTPNPPPKSFVLMKPDITLADLLFEKQQRDLGKRKNMFQDIGKFEQKKKALEANQSMLKAAIKKAHLNSEGP